MPVELEVLDGGKGLVRKMSGHLTAEELSSSVREFVASVEDVRRVRYSILDYSQVAGIDDVSTEEIRAIAEMNKRTSQVNPNILVAQVSPRDVVYGLSRMWQILLDVSDVPWETKVFRSRSEAEAWLEERLGAESDQES